MLCVETVEQLPCLKVSDLTRTGALRYARSLELSRAEIIFSIRSDLRSGFLDVESRSLSLYQRIYLECSAVFGKSLRYYFRCPVTFRRCSHLFYHAGRFVSRRACYGYNRWSSSRRQRRETLEWSAYCQVMGINGYPPARGERRSSAILFLQSQAFIWVRYPELVPVFRAHEEKLERAALRTLRSNLHQGSPDANRSANYIRPLTQEEIDACLTDSQDGSFSRAGAELPNDLPVAFREDHPVLDVGALVRLLKPFYGDACGQLIAWSTGLQAKVLLDLRSYAKPRLTIHRVGGATTPEPQVIELVRGGRWYMRCPIAGTRHDLFFYRHATFASPKALCLVHRSQR